MSENIYSPLDFLAFFGFLVVGIEEGPSENNELSCSEIVIYTLYFKQNIITN